MYEQELSEDKDRSLIFQWVFYYDTLARVGVKNWRGFASLQLQLEKELGFDKGTSRCPNEEVYHSYPVV